jgi:L-serine dehydratase
MDISVFDLFKIGIGPSSSHTIGPMRAARIALEQTDHLEEIVRVKTILYGSLALTGRGHGTDKAIMLGLSGERQDEVNTKDIPLILSRIEKDGGIYLLGNKFIPFNSKTDIEFNVHESLAFHPNALKIEIYFRNAPTLSQIFYSIGGGFVLQDGEKIDRSARNRTAPPHPFNNANELLSICSRNSISIAELIRENELSWLDENNLNQGLDSIWDAMNACINRGLETSGILPGGLKVKRRAPEMHQQLLNSKSPLPHQILDWISLFAIAVNEENAAGGQVVTAPTNGAAGIIPAVIKYYIDYCEGANRAGIRIFLLTASAIGSLFKRNASISGAEVGCQGEVGAACAMAAAGLTAALGGSNEQIENAAEIGIEHHLGMTCDPVGGLVQIPCIERNAMGSIKAVNAASLALKGNGKHAISLDQAIETVKTTGADMQNKYKETSLGGLAILGIAKNRIEC